MKRSSGFTLTELMVTLAIFAILAAVAVPNFMGWRANAKFRGAVNNLKADLNLARLSAGRQSTFTTVDFRPDRYVIWIDVNNNGDFDSGEVSVRTRVLPSGVTINQGATDFGTGGTLGNPQARFDNRGLPVSGFFGTVVLNSRGDARSVTINRLGRLITD